MEVWVSDGLPIPSENRGLVQPAASSGSVRFNHREEVIKAIRQAADVNNVIWNFQLS